MNHWSLLREMEDLRREMDRLFAGVTQTAPLFRSAFLPGRAARQYPLVNVSEDTESLYIQALSPGLDLGSLNVTVVRNSLTVSGEKPVAHAGIEPEAYHRNERAAGKFVRTIELPVEVDETKVTAEYKNGLLLITLPKAERAKPKQISIKVA